MIDRDTVTKLLDKARAEAVEARAQRDQFPAGGEWWKFHAQQLRDINVIVGWLASQLRD